MKSENYYHILLKKQIARETNRAYEDITKEELIKEIKKRNKPPTYCSATTVKEERMRNYNKIRHDYYKN